MRFERVCFSGKCHTTKQSASNSTCDRWYRASVTISQLIEFFFFVPEFIFYTGIYFLSRDVLNVAYAFHWTTLPIQYLQCIKQLHINSPQQSRRWTLDETTCV